MQQTNIIVIGAGASGLAVAAALRRRGCAAVILERDDQVGGTWARRYDRLCLHTTRRFSGLPYLPMPRTWPRYVPKDLYATYLADYADHMQLDVRFGQPVERIQQRDGRWLITTRDGAWLAAAVVIATGKFREPRLPPWPGIDLFRGTLIHAAEYRSGRSLTGKRVLVVGIGNSGAEIAADLVEQNAASVAISVRNPPPITSREILGVPVQVFGMLLAPFPPRLVDRLGTMLRRIGTGDLSRFGLGSASWGPFTARRPPVIDVGFLDQLKAGRIEVLPDVERFTPDGVTFADKRSLSFDVVVAATGFTTGLDRLICVPGLLDDRGLPMSDASSMGLFFAGFSESPRGQLFESSHQAPKLARAIDHYLSKPANL